MFDGPRHIDTDPKERLARLRLARSPRIGAVTFHEALAHFGSARAACAEVSAISAAQAEREQERLEAMGGQFVVWGDTSYPATLAALPDAPPVLAAIGDLRLLARPTLAIVGARDASLAGRQFAGELARALGTAGFVVASGLARGIDTAAHEAALATGTIAILAGGIDQIYPPQNAGLQEAIASGGVAACRIVARRPACRQGVPAPQSDRRRPVRRGGGDRSSRKIGIPDHRPSRCGAGSRGVCRPWLADGPKT